MKCPASFVFRDLGWKIVALSVLCVALGAVDVASAAPRVQPPGSTGFESAEARAAVRRVLETRMEQPSTLARAVISVRDQSEILGRLADEALASELRSLGRSASEPLQQLLLEKENLRIAYETLQEELAAGRRPRAGKRAGDSRIAPRADVLRDRVPERPRRAVDEKQFRTVRRLVELTERLDDEVRAGNRREVERLLRGIETAAARVQRSIQRGEPRTSGIVRRTVPEVRRPAIPIGPVETVPVGSVPTIEVPAGQRAGEQITPEISALAAELGFDPLAIYLHVRNNFRFETYFGHLKGAQATLETGGGNDYDLAALTGSLLSASGFNVRYARGTAIIPAQAIIDWLGIEDPAAANPILNTAGISATAIVSGPDIIEYRVDRFWVEVETSLRPGGALVWLPLDTAFKKHDLSPGIPGLLAAVPFDEATYLSVARTELTWEFYAQQIQDHLDLSLPGSTLAEVPLGMTPVRHDVGSLPRSLPYQLYDLGAIYSAIPGTLAHKVTLRVRYLGFTEFSHPIVLPEAALKRITVSYIVDPADQGIVDGYGGLANTPPGAVDVIPQLKLDGAMVAQGGTIPYLDPVTVEADFFKPEGDVFDGTEVHTVRAGEWVAIGIDAFQISETHLQRQVDAIVEATALEDSGGTADPDDLIGAFLYLAIMQYHDSSRIGDEVLTGLSHFRQLRFVSEGIASANQDVVSVGGTPFTTLPNGLVVDVPRLNRTNFALDDDNTLRPDLRRISGFNGSAQEHAIWESYLNLPAISTIKSLQLANERGVPVFVIDDNDADPDNDCADLCPLLTLDSTTVSNIQGDVAGGNRVTAPRDPTPLNDWDGVGYITENPVSGSVGYIISGGLNSASGPATPPRFDLSGGAMTVVVEDGVIYLVPAGQDGDAPGTANTGDPVNIASGNFFRNEIDFEMPALGERLGVERVYNSRGTFDGPFGIGWAHNYGDRLVVQPDDSVIWIDGRGTAFTFQPDVTPGEYIAQPGLRETLTDTGSGFTMVRYDGRTQTFDTDGLLLSRADRSGNTFTFAYDASDRLSTVTDPASRTLTFTYTAADKIETISDFTGRTWIYAYDGNDRLAQVTSPSDAQTLARVTQYVYGDNGLISDITEPNGGVRRIRYYANGRVAQVVDPHGHAMGLLYNGFKSETRVSNERGLAEVHVYNAAGNRVALVYPDASVKRWSWVDNRITSHTDPLGNTETFEYDAAGNLERTVDPTDIETFYDYEPPFSNLVLVTRPGGRTTSRQYDPSGNLTQEIDGAGKTRTVTPDALGLPETVVDGRGNTITFQFNVDGQVTTRSTELPSVETTAYDPRGTVQQKIDANSDARIFEYDLLDRVIREEDAEGGVTRFSYDAGGRLISKRDPIGNESTFEYDLLDRLIVRSYADGSEVRFEYDEVGNLVREIDELGRVTRAVYDLRNRRIAVHAPDGAVTRTAYDGAGRVRAITDPLGNTTHFEYDKAGRKTAEIDAVGERTEWTFDENGNRATQIDRLGGVTTFEYDGLNRQVEIRGEGGRIRTLDYDGNGNVIETTDYDVQGLGSIPDDPRTLPESRKRTRSRTYDVLNRLETETDPEGHVVVYGYDPAGNLISARDQRLKTTTADYDKANRLVRLIRPDLGEVGLTYDPAGNRIGLQTPRDGAHSWAYDARNRIISQTDPLGNTTAFEYDLVGNRVRQSGPDGTWVAQSYDPANRVAFVSRSDGTFVDRTYDPAGNLRKATTERTRVELTYDELNRRVSETLEIPEAGFSKTVNYEYDDEGGLTLITDPEGRTLTYIRDPARRVTQLTDSGGPSITLTYNGYSQRETVTYGNGTVGQHEYDGNGRPTLIDWTAAIAQFDYTRDAVGNPTTIIESVAGQSETLTVGYDDFGRPTSATAAISPGTRSETFTYDENDNVTSPGTGTSSTFDLGDQLLTGAGGVFVHDRRGNREAFDDGLVRVETRHDPDNRLIRIERFTGGSSDYDARLTYDGLSRLVEIRTGASATRIVHAFENRLVEYDASSALTVTYTPGDGLDDMFATTIGGVVRYLHRDTVNSIRAVTDGAGAVVGSRHYGLFGRTQVASGVTDLTLGFGGRPFDDETGLLDMRARFFDPQTATFISRDPISFPAITPNPYTYSANRPLILFDPWGLAPEQPERGFWSALWDDGFLLVDVGFIAFDILTFPSGEAVAGIAARRAGREIIEEVAEQGIKRKVRNEIVEEGAQRGGRAIVEIGKAGERAVGNIGPKVKVAINGRNRIPDGLTNTILSEVKNVKNLSYTRQLRDFADYAQKTGRQFDLYVRPSTKLSGPLVDAIKSGVINLKVIP